MNELHETYSDEEFQKDIEELEESVKKEMAEEQRKVKNLYWLWGPEWHNTLVHIEWYLTGAPDLAGEKLKDKPNGSRFKYWVRLRDGRDELHITFNYLNCFYPESNDRCFWQQLDQRL